MYIVISIPNRKSIAVGVSQVMSKLLYVKIHGRRATGDGQNPSGKNLRHSRHGEQRKHLEPSLMIFMKGERPVLASSHALSQD